ncbi:MULTISPECIES: O-methyltransferase [unclassified Enterococcus]|uniref:O-methyltransferase n=1 Tax=unclassified Enterococcus TaxID=2608891 RepID=UPI0015559065|nr:MULTISPECIES: O-methyltransferase [unclassified Enterococcus]MBS7577471.1 O-methyltransferase [Enterococcus sp. MMGLQ5-2]MBS7584877.1 O-methyltransferase [Enterococcus sp. MMGLQ5-1]NPD12732.1 O-methyltransferase [Enterococcus sp. MMGLQ5-1]NPD37303.1 O-methyltransferase [Enterococcus sp. MMGLQ5-2]
MSVLPNSPRNEMMNRPVVQPEVVKYMRQKLRPLHGELREVQKEAQKKNVPIIPQETVAFMQFLLGQIKPQKILEIGAAVGFSASLMSEILPQAEVTTIDRYDVMIKQAKNNFKRLDLTEKITLLEGEAAEILKTLPSDTYDFIFMDSAKSKYIVFLPEILRIMKKGAVLMVDDVLQGGTIVQDFSEIPRGKRAIHKGLTKFLDSVLNCEGLTTSIVPLGDGLVLITKENDYVKILSNN